ncbi:Uncharacterised protein [Flavobacterium hibernum]|nr:Uncharacterised protein [Flavobacterium hibernum]
MNTLNNEIDFLKTNTFILNKISDILNFKNISLKRRTNIKTFLRKV